MKEQFRPIELTNTRAQPTLRTGDIFMDNGQNEQPPQQGRWQKLFRRAPAPAASSRPPEPAIAGSTGRSAETAYPVNVVIPQLAQEVIAAAGARTASSVSAAEQAQIKLEWLEHMIKDGQHVDAASLQTIAMAAEEGIRPGEGSGTQRAREAKAKLSPEVQAKMQELMQQGRLSTGLEGYVMAGGPPPPPVAPAAPVQRIVIPVGNYPAGSVLRSVAELLDQRQRANQTVDVDLLRSSVERITRAQDQGLGPVVPPQLYAELTNILETARIEKQTTQGKQQQKEGSFWSQHISQEDKESFREAIEERVAQGPNVRMDRDRIMGWLEEQFDFLYAQPIRGTIVESDAFTNFRSKLGDAKRFLGDFTFKDITDPAERQRRRHELLTIIGELDDQYLTTYNLIIMQSAMAFRNMDGVMRAAGNLKTHGLMMGFALENGKVGAMYHVIDEYVEDQRLKDESHHVHPHVLNNITSTEGDDAVLVNKQMELAYAGVGPFADIAKRVRQNPNPQNGEITDLQLRSNVVRSLRTAYDLWVATQRQAVIVTRGRHIPGGQFRSDPVGPLNIYNIEEFFHEKWTNRNVDVPRFLERVKLSLAEDYLEKQGGRQQLTRFQKVELGTRLFRDFINIPDYFSSGWRIDDILAKLQDRCNVLWSPDVAKQKAEDLGLFMRLIPLANARKPRHPDRKKLPQLVALWEKIARYQPEEILRLYQERIADDPLAATEYKDPHDSNHLHHREAFNDLPDLKPLLKRFNEVFVNNNPNNVFRRYAVRDYKQFKELQVTAITRQPGQPGRIVNLSEMLKAIRQEGYTTFEQVDFANPQPWVRQRLVNTFGIPIADDIKEMYAVFSRFGEGSEDQLIHHYKFEDVYKRALKTDDGLLNELELKEFSKTAQEGFALRYFGAQRDPQSGAVMRDQYGRIIVLPQYRAEFNLIENAKFQRVSEMYSSEAGGDAYVRDWGDTGAAVQAIGTHLIKALTTEKTDKRVQAAEEMYSAIVSYNGVDNAVEGIHFIVGTHYIMSKMDKFPEIIGLAGKPLRQAASDLQRLYGSHADALNQEQRREALDHLKEFYMQAGQQLNEDELRLPPEEQEELKHYRHKEAEKRWQDIEKQLEVRGRDFARKRGISLLLYLFLVFAVETWNAADVMSTINSSKK